MCLPNVWEADVVDLQALRTLPVFRMMAEQGAGLPAGFEAMDSVCFYWIGPEGTDLAELQDGGVALLGPGGRDTLLAGVPDLDPVRLEGQEAYGHGTAFTAFPLGNVALFGTTEASFRAVARAYDRGRRADLQAALGELLPMAPGDAVTLTFRASVVADVPDGTVIANQGRLTSAELTTEVLSDSTDSSLPGPADPTLVTVAYPDLEIVKSFVDDNGGDVEPGDLIRFAVRVTNNGSFAASGVQVTFIRVFD